MNAACVFCNYAGPSAKLWDAESFYVIEPLDPVTEGHVLVIPTFHVPDASHALRLTGEMFRLAAWWAVKNRLASFNLITSAGRPATQSIDHLHVHVVPRRTNDGLSLPWSKE